MTLWFEIKIIKTNGFTCSWNTCMDNRQLYPYDVYLTRSSPLMANWWYNSGGIMGEKLYPRDVCDKLKPFIQNGNLMKLNGWHTDEKQILMWSLHEKFLIHILSQFQWKGCRDGVLKLFIFSINQHIL